MAIKTTNPSGETSSPSKIVVIGAGILGLTSALTLQQEYPTSKIIIVAESLPLNQQFSATSSADYASAWAGAHYRPIPFLTDPSSSQTPALHRQLAEEAQITRRAFEVFKKESSDPANGIILVDGVEYFEKPAPEHLQLKDGSVYAGDNDDFQIIPSRELPEGVKWGYKYKTFCVSPNVYCPVLLRRFVDRGGKVVQKKLARVEDAFGVDDGGLASGGASCPSLRQDSSEETERTDRTVVVNCSGRGFNDPKSFVIRGQTVLVENDCGLQTITRQNSDGTWTFLIPRALGGGTVVGGTKEVGDMTDVPRPETREKLLKAAERCFPWILKPGEKWQVIRDNVGRRPAREGGIRLEVQSVAPGKSIVHAYGVGGRGYEMSWGVAEKVLGLVSDLIEDHVLRAKL
ncbi:nucleotide-binding domain-containing protein [Xylona heveae TC161]|uniref:Nucleotide-binding domain-containing protein n=1 Tax=Xylona heveae (strain CBS 132557 / TC161) TaxID=1328760 RepID=A0A165IMG2_XYLHT|nr:nucleotide-binding domain-containing protein [Xylona heveae TC161]KZF25108.1 nucleotide-binding domain-containing protein [Xylona heveae TC161]